LLETFSTKDHWMTRNSTDTAQHSTLTIAQRVKTLQIITLAMVMGICAFGMFVLSPVKPGAAAPQVAPELGMLSFAAVGMLVICGTLAAALPRVIVNAQLKRLAEAPDTAEAPPTGDRSATLLEALLGAYQTQLIVRAALVEGPAFLGLFAYMTERHFAVLMVPAVSIGILFTSFPTVGKVTGWVEQQLAERSSR